MPTIQTEAGAARYGKPIGSTYGSGASAQQQDPNQMPQGLLKPETIAAIKRFQQSHGLPVTGQLDAKTVGYTQAHKNDKANAAAAKKTASAAGKAQRAKDAAARKATADAKKKASAVSKAQKAKRRAAAKAAKAKQKAAKDALARQKAQAVLARAKGGGKNTSGQQAVKNAATPAVVTTNTAASGYAPRQSGKASGTTYTDALRKAAQRAARARTAPRRR